MCPSHSSEMCSAIIMTYGNPFRTTPLPGDGGVTGHLLIHILPDSNTSVHSLTQDTQLPLQKHSAQELSPTLGTEQPTKHPTEQGIFQ